MIKSLQICSITNTGSEMLLSVCFISVSSAELDMGVMHKKVYGSYCSAFPWDALRLLMALFFCYWNISAVPVAMWNTLMTLEEREHVVGIIVNQVQKWGWVARQHLRDSATLVCIQPLTVPPGGDYFWDAFFCLMVVVLRHDLLCKHILPQWSAEVSLVFPESFSSSNTICHI